MLPLECAALVARPPPSPLLSVSHPLATNAFCRDSTTEMKPYHVAYSIKCVASAIATITLALASTFVFETPADFVKGFALYFVFDSIYDLGMDLIFRPTRRNFELVIQVHHLLGLYTMYTLPDTPACIESYRWITIGEVTSPFLYCSLLWKEVRGVEAPSLVSGMMLALWPIVRFCAPLVSLQRQWHGNCGTVQFFATFPYIAMNVHFFVKLAKRQARKIRKQ